MKTTKEMQAAAMLLGISAEELAGRMAKPLVPEEKPDRLLRITEAAKMLTVSRRTVGYWIKQGRLPMVTLSPGHRRRDNGHLVGGRVAIPLSAVSRIVAEGVPREEIRAAAEQPSPFEEDQSSPFDN